MEKRVREKTRPELVKLAQRAFNWYIRERDHFEPCISCGKDKQGHQVWDCGHFFSVGAHPSVRFNPWNAHKQCKHCNRYLSGNIHNYKRYLLLKIKQLAFDNLEKEANQTRKFTREELQDIAKTYNAKARQLQKERESG